MSNTPPTNEVHTIKEWEAIIGVQILDPDGFDRKDPNLYERKFTESEFRQGMMMSTVMQRLAPPTDNNLDELLKAVYGAGRNSRLKLSDNEVIEKWMSVDQAKAAILTHYIKKSDVLDIVMGAIPKDYPRKVGLNFAQLWDSADATDGYNQALRDVEQALTTALKERL